MVSTERVLLIVAADRRELAGIARRSSGVHSLDLGITWARAGKWGPRSIVLAANGPGRANAAKAVESASARLNVAGVVSTGLCGGLDPSLVPGQVVVASKVLSLEPPLEFSTCRPAGSQATGVVLTVDRVVESAGEKARLRSTGAIAVDMEAAGVAAAAQKRALAFFCIRAVSDGAAQSFRIDYNRARLPDGRFSMTRIVAQAGLDPRRWKELLGWWQAVRLGSEKLGEIFVHLDFGL